MNSIRKLIKDIDRGIQLRKNLPAYAQVLSDTYLDYAAIELTFSAYMLSEIILDDIVATEVETKWYDQVKELLAELLTSTNKEQLQEVIESIKNVRNQITAIMDGFTSYTDQLICYDYVLKRMRLDYVPKEEELEKVKGIREDEFMQQLMTYLVGNRDQSMVRDRLQMLMGEIPVHLTKQKLLEKVQEALSLYQGSDRASLDSFLYMLRSAAMLHRADATGATHETIRAFIRKMHQYDFSEMTTETYVEITQEFEQISDEIMALTDYYFALQKVVNGIYALALARVHNSQESVITKDCYEILSRVVKDGLDDSGLVKLEGKIEECVEKSGYLEAVLFQIKESSKELLDELQLQRAFDDYAAISTLLSDSLFVDLEHIQSDEVVDKAMLKEVYGAFSEELSEALKEMKRPVKKAVMAALLEKIPVDFSNTTEIEQYIRTNLFGCQDFSEKGMVLLELTERMEETE